MKKQSFNIGLFSSIDKKTMEDLTSEVKETIAFNLVNQHTNFTTADLWNIQRRSKPRNQRRYL